MSIKRWDNFKMNEENQEVQDEVQDEIQKEPRQKYDINVNVDDTLELINGIVNILLHDTKEGYAAIGDLLDKNDKLITGFPKKGTDDFDRFHDDLFERLRRAIRISIKHVNIENDEERDEKQLVKESKVYQSRPPQKFEKLSQAIEEAGFKNTFLNSEIEVDGNIEDGNIFINDEPLNFTIFENDEVYWNDFSGSKEIGRMDKHEQLVASLKKFLTKE